MKIKHVEKINQKKLRAWIFVSFILAFNIQDKSEKK